MMPRNDLIKVKSLIDLLYSKDWVVYTKKPFSTVNHIVNYLARYSHRVAITNHRIKSIDKAQVVFEYKDYKDRALKKTTRLSTQKFISRFCLHILPPGFRKIRQFDLTSNASKSKDINRARLALGQKLIVLLNRKERKSEAINRLFGDQAHLCPHCKVGHIHTISSKEGKKDPPFQANPFEQFR